MDFSSQAILNALEVSQRYADKYTYAVFTSESRSEPKLLGSSVIIEYKSKSYFVTAGHVIRAVNRVKQGIMLFTKSGLVSLSGQWVITEGEDDNLDIGIVHLSSEFVQKNGLNVVKSGIALPWDFVENVAYGFTHGYPLSRNKYPRIRLKKAISAYAYAGKFFYDEALFVKHGKSLLKHTCLSYGNNVQKNTPVKPKGKSGSGVWYITNLESPDSIYLDSILIEYNEGSKVVFSTKILWVFKIIEQYW
ncbi:MAG: hypothetical protein LAT53_06440 [Idiomarina sp.]|nr:hypothetical protein [Idiomarina sp.]